MIDGLAAAAIGDGGNVVEIDVVRHMRYACAVKCSDQAEGKYDDRSRYEGISIRWDWGSGNVAGLGT